LLRDGSQCVEKLRVRLTSLLTTLGIREVWAIREKGRQKFGQITGEVAGSQSLLKIAESYGDISLRWKRFVEKARNLTPLFESTILQYDLSTNAT
jgi:hypothetical protein